MKRLRKLASIALAWTSVCLLSVDPVSACRLLGNRRCCTCCCPSSCSSAVPVYGTEQGEKSDAPQPTEPSPSDLPRPTAGDAVPPPTLPTTTTPTSPSIGLQPSVGSARGSVAEHSQPSASPAAPAVNAPPVPPITEPRLERSRADAQPPVVTSAPLPGADAVRRQPSDVAASPVTSANTADIGHAAGKPLTNAVPMNLSPQPTTLTPQPAFSATTPAAEIGQSPDRILSVTPGAPAAAKAAHEETADRAFVESAPSANTRQPAAASAAPSGTVTKPAFPTVSDDPFTPLVSPSNGPPTSETHGDDPFAPLPASPSTNEKPAASLVIEPTTKKLDLLAPGSDGRLPLREWTDNSGKFQVKAKLVLVVNGKVRLLKETGRTTTVPLERLSSADRTYVAAAVERYGEDLAKLHQLASR